MQQQSKPKKAYFCWCFHSADWKREEILDHSFSLINVNDYLNKSLTMKIKYLWIFFVVFKTVLVYMSDLYLLFQSLRKKYMIGEDCKENLQQKYHFFCEIGDISIFDVNIVKILMDNMFFLLLFSISVTYILSFLEFKKAQKIIKSQDISFAFTNLVAYRYYCIKSYAYYCFFQLIQDHKKPSDDIAFFVFFTFKGWKRFMFADSPRRILNFIILINSLSELCGKNWNTSEHSAWFAFITSTFILSSWLITGISLLIAFIIYIPLLTVIQGNLKEYCCHKIDKRIGEIINSKTQQKIKKIQKVEQAKREAAKKLGVNPNQLHLDESALKKGFDIEILPDPTLPQIDVDLNDVGTGTYPQNNYYNQYGMNNQFNNNNFFAQYNGGRNQYQGSDYSDSLNRYDNASSDSGSRNGSLPYNVRNIQTKQPQPQYMNTPYNNSGNGSQYSTYNNSSSLGAQQWNAQPKMPTRNQGWNDQMSNSSSNYSNNLSNAKPVYRRTGGTRPPYDTVSITSEEPLLQTPPRSTNPRNPYHKKKIVIFFYIKQKKKKNIYI